jgi:cell division protein FtsZ
MMLEMEETELAARIKVVGVGGAGGNAVNRMVESGFTNVEFIAINTDNQALEHSKADNKLSIGLETTRGLGAGAKPEVGMRAIEEDIESVRSSLEGADMVFITAGMGGGTGTGAAPVVAQVAKEMGILSVAVVTRPFLFEGPIRRKNSMRGLEGLRQYVDTIITIQNQNILSIADKNTSFEAAFGLADEVLTNAVRGISEIILKHGYIQVDFADVRAIMENGGDALMGTGIASGENRAIEAAKEAIASPLLDDVSIAGASGLLVNITAGRDFGIHEANEAMSYIYEVVGESVETNIIYGTTIDENMHDEIAITVIATGFTGGEFGNAPGATPVKKSEPETLAFDNRAAIPAANAPTQAMPVQQNAATPQEAAYGNSYEESYAAPVQNDFHESQHVPSYMKAEVQDYAPASSAPATMTTAAPTQAMPQQQVATEAFAPQTQAEQAPLLDGAEIVDAMHADDLDVRAYKAPEQEISVAESSYEEPVSNVLREERSAENWDQQSDFSGDYSTDADDWNTPAFMRNLDDE